MQIQKQKSVDLEYQNIAEEMKILKCDSIIVNKDDKE